MANFTLLNATPRLVWPERREIPCRDLDVDCFALDGVVPFGGYAKCQAYAPELGRCIFLHDAPAETPLEGPFNCKE